MQAQKLSISLSKAQCDFIATYQATHHYKTRSEVIREAIHLLQQVQLEAYYKEANHEIEDDFENSSQSTTDTK